MGTTRTTWLKGGAIAIQPAAQKMETIINFADLNCVATDVIQALTIPAKTFVAAVGFEVLTVEDSTLTFDIGDDVAGGGDVDGYLDGVDGEVLTGAVGAATGYAGSGKVACKYYHAADTIDVLINNDADTLKLRVWAIIMPAAAVQPTS